MNTRGGPILNMTGKRKKFKFANIAILATILVLPGFLYYLLEREGENRYRPLPVFGEKVLTGTFTSRMGEKIPDTAFHRVSDFRLTNEKGEVVPFLPADSGIAVVNFFYTRCETFCLQMNNEMNRVAERFIANPALHFYTLSVDTMYDSPDILFEYSKDYNPDSKKWQFFTNGPDDVMKIARQDFLVDALQDTTQEAHFIHSSSLILVDSRHRIRGYYDVTHLKEVDRLIDEIKLLLIEEVRLKSLL